MKTSELAQRLNAAAVQVARHLIPNGRQEGLIWKCGNVHGEEGKSLCVNIGGQWQGKWKDWAESDFHGDLLDLWMHVKAVTVIQARKEAIAFLGLSDKCAPAEEKTYKNPPASIGDAEPDPNGKLFNYLTGERKLTPAIINRFKVTGVPKTREIVYPSYSSEGQLLNRCYIALERDEEGKKKVRQDAGCAPSMFGWQAWDQDDFNKGYVVITEGQLDCMSWRQWGHPALSIPNGNGMTWIAYNYEDLAGFETIYLSFDMDGKVDVRAVAKRLGMERCRIVHLPKKDANECLQTGLTSSDQWLADSKYINLPTLSTAEDLREDFYRHMAERHNPIGITMDILSASFNERFYVRPGEVTLWAGISGHGKSSFLRWLFMQLLMRMEPTGIASLEVKPTRTLEGMYKSFCKIKRIELSEFISAVSDGVVFYNRIGYAPMDELFETIQYAAKRYGVKHFMIDSLMRVEGLEEDYPAQGKFMNRLQELAKTCGVHIHLVVHERKSPVDTAPDGDAIKGSSLIRNNADNIIFVRRNIQKRNDLRDGKITREDAASLPDATLYIEKDREGGISGKIDLRYDITAESFYRFHKLETEADRVATSTNCANGTHARNGVLEGVGVSDPYRGKRGQ